MTEESLESKPFTYKKLTPAQTNKIGALLHLHLHNVPDQGYSLYDEGWSDEEVARQVGITVASVVYRRKNDESFLRLRVAPVDKSTQKIWEKTSELVAKHNLLVEFVVQKFAHTSTERTNLLDRFRIEGEKIPSNPI